MQQGSDLSHRKPGLVEITCPNATAFKKSGEFVQTAKLLSKASERVASGAMTKATFSNLETAAGFRANRHGVAVSSTLEPHLDLPDIINYDWVHSALQGGVLTGEVEAMLATTAVPRSDLQDFLADVAWEYPGARRQKSRYLHRVFDARRVATDSPERVKASCSELLGLYGLLRCFFNLRFAGDPSFAPRLASFNMLCHSLDLILSFKHGLRSIDVDSVGELQSAMGRHLEQHIAVYGEAHVRPKHHWFLDCPQQFLRDQLVLDAFVIERGHLEVKRIAEFVRNTRVFERSVLAGVVCEALRDDRRRGGSGLVGPSAVVPGTGVAVADRADVHCQQFAVDDVILRSSAVGIVKACAVECGDLYFLVEPLRLVSQDAPCCGSYVTAGGLEAWDAREACHTLAWRRRPNGSIFVVCR